ncbi:ABC transporter permease [Oceanibacterium hippocampi]|uniref:Dipeptide transport system permease protein DppB n=1 Tax=Oceanibacterium hippocampi TaxID=745714 RepID=A0A1Y5TPJ0_9PROT|nr:ABC transporter permease [Oceanibacterium hippocampi]SLN66707.1 Dipeptide transport system permease protein DppB [Oceanibacterium hippocampi]
MRFVYAFAAWLPRALLVLVAIGLLNFFLIRLAPGDPASVLAGETGASDARYIEEIRKSYGLDQPLWLQAATYLRNLATFDLGVSYRMQRDVADIIGERIPATLLLTSTALVLAIIIGTLLGIQAARRAGTWQDTVISAFAMLCYATPVFWVGLLLVLLLSVHAGILPPFGMSGLIPKSGFAAVLDALHHLVLPVMTLALFYFAVYVRLGRSATVEVLGRDFVRSARAKGLSERQVLRRHVLRNSVIPVVTMAGLQVGQLLGGAVIVESVFAWPGIGRLAFDALMQRDYNLILGIFFVSSIMVVLANLITDLAVRSIDPRVGRS